MAQVVITIKDEEGSVDVNAEFDPPANNGTEDTPAQYVAKSVLLALSEAMNPDVIETVTDEPA